MDGRTVRVPRARTVKLATAIFVATAAMVAAVMMATNLVADAQESSATAGGAADSDGNVPVVSACFGAPQGTPTDQYVGEQQYAGEQQYPVVQYPSVQSTFDQYSGTQYPEAQYAGAQYAGAQYATSEYSSEQLGLYTWYNDGSATYGTITIDDCALDAMGAGPEDRERVLAHERGHAAGLLHSDVPGDIMYPIVSIEGR